MASSGKMSPATGNGKRMDSTGDDVMNGGGSPRSYSSQGSGPIMGAGMMPRVGPGTASMRVKGMVGGKDKE